MKKIKVKILGLSYSQVQMGSYVIVLSEIKGDKRKLPIIIKQSDAQFIALKMEGSKTPRPTTIDLLQSICDSLGGDIQEIHIHNMLEGIFYSKLILSSPIDTYEIECSIGDAMSLAVIYKCPILVYKDVMDSCSIYMNDNGVITEEQVDKNRKSNDSKILSIDDLESLIEKAVNNDEFEVATQLRDKIKELKNKIT